MSTRRHNRIVLAACLSTVATLTLSLETRAAEPVKVFILAGQSNMEGKARVSLAEYQAGHGETRKLFAHWRDGDQWGARDDVWIKFLDRKGKLTVGFGSPDCIGPELQFGYTVGDRYEQQVLLIKTAWGGKSLYRDFRSPSSGLPAQDVLASILEKAQKKKPETTLSDVKRSFGLYYRLMLEEVHDTLANLETLFPEYQGQGYEIAGLVWFQGWNDMVNPDYTAQYAENMANFIRDVRKDLKEPLLPVVIGQMGVNGTNPPRKNPKMDAFKEAQAAPASLPEFQGNVALVRTDELWDQQADAVYRSGWRDHLEQWNKVGSNRPYHYLGSVIAHYRMGKAFADAMITMSD